MFVGIFIMKEILLSRGMVALVDDEDYEWLNQWKWYAHKKRNTYYARRSCIINGLTYNLMMHRIILGLTDNNICCDHKDMNGLNNQRFNLRIATVSQNSANRRSLKGSSSKYLGVYKFGNRWRAKIRCNKKQESIGCFKTEKEAGLAYNLRATELHGEFANLNVI